MFQITGAIKTLVLNNNKVRYQHFMWLVTDKLSTISLLEFERILDWLMDSQFANVIKHILHKTKKMPPYFFDMYV